MTKPFNLPIFRVSGYLYTIFLCCNLQLRIKLFWYGAVLMALA